MSSAPHAHGAASPRSFRPFAGLGHDLAAVRVRASVMRLHRVTCPVRRILAAFGHPCAEYVPSGFALQLMLGRETRGR